MFACWVHRERSGSGFFDFWTFENIPIRITQNGLERIRVDNGNVGIGTTSPSARLEVRDGTGANGSGAHVQIGEAAPNAAEKLIQFRNGG